MSKFPSLQADIAKLRAKINRLTKEAENSKGQPEFRAYYDRQKGTVSGGPIEESETETLPIVYVEKDRTRRV